MVLNLLKEVIPENQIETTAELQHPLGNHAPYTVYPHSEEEIAAILKIADEHSLKVIPMGGGTKRGFGGLGEKGDILLSLASLKGVIEHSVGDMTMSVRPGTTIKEIAEQLAKVQQMIPLDPFSPDQATIGGVVASNDSGPKRLRYGSARDHVIGMRIVYPDGRIIRTGGKVVKNVAGYDMNKLFIGSMGTLGVISEITMKLRPLPKYSSLVLLTFSETDIEKLKGFIIQLLDSTMEPISLEMLTPPLHHRLNQKQGFGLAIAFEDLENSVNYQEEWIKSQVPQETEINILQHAEAKEWWSAFAAIIPQNSHPDQTSNIEIALKIGSKNVDVVELLKQCHQLGRERQVQIEAHGGAGHGISRAYVKGNVDQLVLYVQTLRSSAQELGGYVIVQHAPLDFRKKIQVWGEKPAHFPILDGIKRTMDPNRVLNDKRFVGGM